MPDPGWNRRPEQIDLKGLLAEKKIKLGIPEIEKPAAWKPAETHEEAAQFAKQRFGVKEVDFTGIKLDSVNAINEELTNLYDSFPDMRGKIGFIGSDLNYIPKYVRAPPMGSNTLAYTTEESLIPGLAYERGYSDLVFNHSRWWDLEIIKGDVQQLFESHWLVDGKVAALVDHEFGHAYFNAQAKIVGGYKRQDFIGTAYSDLKSRGAICEALSRYGDGDGQAEFWAEWFAGYRAQRLSPELKDMIEGILKYEALGE